MADYEAADAMRALSMPAAAAPHGLSRRAFLQGMLATAGVTALLPSWMADLAMAATPLGNTDGILILLQFGGGNDGLNMVPPIGTSAYYANRPVTAIPATGAAGVAALPLTGGMGLHPKLTYTKSLWDAGHVAVMQGVGNLATSDLSHFSSIATWMAGTASGIPTGTGWVGRWLDGLDRDPLRAVSLGSAIPLHMIGSATQATGLPLALTDAFGVDTSDPIDARKAACVRRFDDTSTGLGRLGDLLAASASATLDLGSALAPAYPPSPTQEGVELAMLTMAGIINLNLGVRAFTFAYGDFDQHAGLRANHDARMAELDAALSTFYATLAPAWRNRVTIMTFSEFGRRVPENSSAGVDHGEATSSLVIGHRVAGGLKGTMPSLTTTHWGDLIPSTDFRQVYATVLEDWLGADAAEVLGGTYTTLPLFTGGPTL